MKEVQQPKRAYCQRRRAEDAARTRRRIIDTTLALHRKLGPSATTVSEIARRAHVQRLTVYNHFPTDADLFAACSAHWRALHPTPNVDAWLADEDPRERLLGALEEIYGWYRETEPMTANVLRDSETLPALAKIIDRGLGNYLRQAAQALADPFRAQAVDSGALDATIRAVLDFHFWRSLKGLGDRRAAQLGSALVKAAVGA